MGVPTTAMTLATTAGEQQLASKSCNRDFQCTGPPSSMRLCCTPRATPRIVHSRTPSCVHGRGVSAPALVRYDVPVSPPRKRYSTNQPSPTPIPVTSRPTPQSGSSSSSPPPSPPPLSNADASSKTPPPENEAEEEKSAQSENQQAIWISPIDNPVDDPMRWYMYDPELPPRTTSKSPFDVLANDHRRILYLAHLLRYEPDMRTKEVLLWRMHKEVIFHDIVEKRVLYPILKSVLHKTDPKNTAVARVKKEHSTIRRELRRLKRFKNPGDPLLANAVNLVVHRLKVHFHEEESKTFPLLESHLPDGVQRWMFFQMQVWAVLVRLLGPLAARSRRPPWDRFLNRMWSLWHWRWGR